MEPEYYTVWSGDMWRQDRVFIPCPEPTPETRILGPRKSTPRRSYAQDTILACLWTGSFVASDIAKETGVSLSSVHRRLRLLVERGEVELTRHRGDGKSHRWGMNVYRLPKQEAA